MRPSGTLTAPFPGNRACSHLPVHGAGASTDFVEPGRENFVDKNVRGGGLFLPSHQDCMLPNLTDLLIMRLQFRRTSTATCPAERNGQSYAAAGAVYGGHRAE